MVSIIICCFFVCAKNIIVPKLMKNANFGVSHATTIKNLDFLLIGSSMFRQGIDINTVLGEDKKGYLLAYNGNQPYFVYKEMENFYERGGKTKFLLIDMYAYSLANKVTLSDVRILLDSDIKGQLEMFKDMRDYGNADAKTFYNMFLQTNNELFLTWPISFPLINKRYLNGGNTSKRKGKTEDALSHLKPIATTLEINKKQLESLLQLIELCHSNNTNMIFVETPKYKRIYNINDDYISIMKKYADELNKYNINMYLHRETLARIPLPINQGHIHVYDFDNDIADNYTDMIHLSYNGRMTFSKILNKILKDKLN